MKKCFIFALFLVVALSSNTLAWERDFTYGTGGKVALSRTTTAEVYGWKSDLFGDVDVKGLVLDLEGEADFSSKTRVGITITHGLSNINNLVFTYNSFDHTGNIQKQVTFDNKKYQAGANIKLKNNWLDLTWAHNFSFWEASNASNGERERTGGFIDGLLGVKVCKTDLDVAGYEPVTNARETGSWSGTFPIPYIGIGAGSKISSNLWLDGHFKIMSANVGDGSVRSRDIDFNAALRLNPSSKDSQWYAVLGYRYFRIDGTSDNDTANLGYRGPTFGIVGRF